MADKLYILEEVQLGILTCPLFSLHAKISNRLRNLVNYKTQRQHWSWSISVCSRAFFFFFFKNEVLKYKKDLAVKLNLRSARSQQKCQSED